MDTLKQTHIESLVDFLTKYSDYMANPKIPIKDIAVSQ